MSAPLFLVDGDRLGADRVVLDGPEGRHAALVRRLRTGERVDLADGVGLIAECSVVGVGRATLDLLVVARRREPPPAPRLVVVQALPKGDRGELAVELLTEIGADEIVPWSAARSVPRWHGERGSNSHARWCSTAREAAKQSRRAWLPRVTPLAGTAEVAARLASAALPVVLHEQAGVVLSSAVVPAEGDIVVVVGPEGGLTEEELSEFAAAGAPAYRLGPSVLRTSTAGVAAAALLLAGSGRWD